MNTRAFISTTPVVTAFALSGIVAKVRALLRGTSGSRSSGLQSGVDGEGERFLYRARDAHDLERRERSLARDEQGDYRMAGW